MKIEIVYTTKSKHMKKVSDEMARWVKTYAKPISDFKNDHQVDLLVIGFDDSFFKDKELIQFVNSLSRNQIKNVSLVNAFNYNTNKMRKVITLCQQNDLPLLREQYTFKAKRQKGLLDQNIIDGARLYIEDMVNIVRNYY